VAGAHRRLSWQATPRRSVRKPVPRRTTYRRQKRTFLRTTRRPTPSIETTPLAGKYSGHQDRSGRTAAGCPGRIMGEAIWGNPVPAGEAMMRHGLRFPKVVGTREDSAPPLSVAFPTLAFAKDSQLGLQPGIVEVAFLFKPGWGSGGRRSVLRGRMRKLAGSIRATTRPWVHCLLTFSSGRSARRLGIYCFVGSRPRPFGISYLLRELHIE
jgi:hypothetical protein